MSELVPQSEIKAIQSRTGILITEAQRLPADTEATDDQLGLQLHHLGDFYKMVGVELRELENKRKAFTAGLNDSLKQINATFKELSEPRQEAKAEADRKIRALQSEQRARIAKENERIRMENEAKAKAAAQANAIAEKHAKPGEAITPIVLPQELEKVHHNTVDTRKKWAFEATDYHTEEAHQMVISYLQASGKYVGIFEMAVREVIRNSDDPSTIKLDCAKIFQDETLVLR